MRARLAHAPLAIALVVASAVAVAAANVSVKKVEAIEGDDTVVKIHLSAPPPAPPRIRLYPKTRMQPDRLAVDLPGVDMHGKPSRTATVGWGGVRRMRLGVPTPDAARLVLDLDAPVARDVATEDDVVGITLRPTAK
jgi:hypothetical protein